MSRTDALTGLYNRRHLDEELVRQLSDANRHHDPLCVLLLDIDHFKKIDDSFGHPAGDLVLCAFADRLRAELRRSDIAGRWGSEEFLVIMPRTDLGGALEVAERLRRATAMSPLVDGVHSINATVSGGCVLGRGEDADALLQSVDPACTGRKPPGAIASSQPSFPPGTCVSRGVVSRRTRAPSSFVSDGIDTASAESRSASGFHARSARDRFHH